VRSYGREGEFLKVWVGSLERTKQHGIPRYGCNDNIKIDLKNRKAYSELYSCQVRNHRWAFVNTRMNLPGPWIATNSSTS
jgi:hypothetical protein